MAFWTRLLGHLRHIEKGIGDGEFSRGDTFSKFKDEFNVQFKNIVRMDK